MKDLALHDWERWEPFLEMAKGSHTLSSDQVRRLEFRLRERPLSLELRAKLCGYYLKCEEQKFALTRAAELALWFVVHYPYAGFDFFAFIMSVFEAPQNKALKADCQNAWHDALKKYPQSPQVLYNAYRYTSGNNGKSKIDWNNLLEKLKPEAKHGGSSLYYLAALELCLGQASQALASLKSAITANPALKGLACSSQVFDPIKEDAKFQALVKQP